MKPACSAVLGLLAVLLNVAHGVPVPTPRQIEYMNDVELVQFMHFSLPTYWKPTREFLEGANPTYHDCETADNTTKYQPCMDPTWFQPTALNTEEWMAGSAALGADEVCLTARHEGGFTMWPSNFTTYGVQASTWRDGKGDVVKEFVASAKKHGIKICYYFNVLCDGYNVVSEAGPKVNGSEYLKILKGELTEILTEYGPVNRLWLDASQNHPNDLSKEKILTEAFALIREISPSTLLSPYSGDIMNNKGGSIYTANGTAPNTTSAPFSAPTVSGEYFYPIEQHGITIQMGPDGATPGKIPTFWFWHDWACVDNKTGCPWVGHVTADAIFESYINITGQGNTILMNIPPDTTGQYNASVREDMHLAGAAINATFKSAVQRSGAVSGACEAGMIVLTIDPTAAFDYVVTREDLTSGQRVSNYSVDYQKVGSDTWEVLVPPVQAKSNQIGDQPSGQTARDQYVGRKRIDLPEINGSLHIPGTDPAITNVAKVRFNCLSSLENPVYMKDFALHRRSVPWKE